MKKKKKNPVWSFFASVKLALILLFILAATSIIGTIIPQNNPPNFYVEQYGENMAGLMQTLQVPDMYNAWWFLLLLNLFSLNLIVCSLERIPNVWRLVTKDNLDTNPERLAKMRMHKRFTVTSSREEAIGKVRDFMTNNGWRADSRDKENGTLLFAQKGAWTRFGVYVVHLSILVIFLGALIGSPKIADRLLKNPHFAFKGSVMLPETEQTSHIFSFGSGNKIPLGFTVRCNYFNIQYYSNGMPKDYLSELTILEDNNEVLTTTIEVNKPLTYKGITFYQSSYQPYKDLVIDITKEDGANLQRIVSPGKQFTWENSAIRYGIINLEARGEAISRFKVWFTDGEGPASSFWIENNREAKVERPSGTYTLRAKQLYATGLQVAKDPGVWVVYLGCIVMLLGLAIAFFMSHRKLYAFVREEDNKVYVLFAGSAHKNKVGFEKRFQQLMQDFS